MQFGTLIRLGKIYFPHNTNAEPVFTHLDMMAMSASTCPPSPESWKTVNRQKIQRQFYRAHACFVKYFLMTKKWQQIKKLAYVTTCGPSGR